MDSGTGYRVESIICNINEHRQDLLIGSTNGCDRNCDSIRVFASRLESLEVDRERYGRPRTERGSVAKAMQ